MSAQNIEIKAFEEKLSAELQETKAQLGEFEARAKGNLAQGEIDTLHRLKTKQLEIDKKRQVLKTLGDAKFGEAKAEIDADVANLRRSLAELALKLKKAG